MHNFTEHFSEARGQKLDNREKEVERERKKVLRSWGKKTFLLTKLPLYTNL